MLRVPVHLMRCVLQYCSRFDVINPAWATLAPTYNLGIPDVAARTLAIRARRAPYYLQVHHWMSSGVPTAVIAGFKMV